MPEYVIEEDKSKQSHIVISKKAARPDPEKTQQAQSAHEEAKNPFYPYDDELEYQFYRTLPDFKRFFDAAQTALDGLADEHQMGEASKLAESQFEELGRKITKS